MPVEPLPLRDIHLPEAVSWWPPAPGWWLLLLLGAVVIAATLAVKHIRRRGLVKRSALSELEGIRRQYQQTHDSAELVRSLSTLMRRASISIHERSETAGLTGERWLRHLDATAARKDFEHGAGRVLATAPYLPHSSLAAVDANELLQLCEDWLQAQPAKGATG